MNKSNNPEDIKSLNLEDLDIETLSTEQLEHVQGGNVVCPVLGSCGTYCSNTQNPPAGDEII